MSHRTLTLAACLMAAAGSALAQPRMTIISGFNPSDISADGNTLGGVRVDNLVRWTRGGAVQVLTGSQRQGASAKLSADGSVVSGMVNNTAGLGGLPLTNYVGARWTNASGWQTFPLIAGASQCGPGSINTPNNISATGRFLVGGSWVHVTSDCNFRAYVYDNTTGITTNLGNAGGVANESSRANDVSADGSVIVGYDQSPTAGVRRPAVWTWNGSAYVEQVIPTTGVPATEGGEIYAVNDAGTIMVGASFAYPNSLVEWTLSGGVWTPMNLGNIPALPSWVPSFYGITGIAGSDLSEDGNTIVGAVTYSYGGEHDGGAFIYTSASGIVDLYDYLAARGTIGLENFPSSGASGFAVGYLGSVAACNADGTSIIGASLAAGGSAWIADLSRNDCLAPAVSMEIPVNSGIFGAQAILNAGFVGSAPMSYQWYRNNVALTDGATAWGSQITGSTTLQLRVTNPTALDCQDQGTYFCRATNGCGNAQVGGYWLGLASCCYANCDASTTTPVLNVLDFSCFLNKFAAGDAYANCDQSTTPPVLNVLDFSCFLNKFAAGCT